MPIQTQFPLQKNKGNEKYYFVTIVTLFYLTNNDGHKCLSPMRRLDLWQLIPSICQTVNHIAHHRKDKRSEPSDGTFNSKLKEKVESNRKINNNKKYCQKIPFS